ncbi:hypothetical protein [Cupriavidus sp. YAF13]|uniref:hypothetical protein n=1 Tax=Cupriavidus sp. YAF13 TaxID=3233075 RepID=UPI003F91FB4F
MKTFRELALDVIAIALAVAYVLGYQAAGNVLLVGYWVLGAVALPLLLFVFLVVLAADVHGRRDSRWEVWRKRGSWWRALMAVARIAFFASMEHVVLAALLMLCGLISAGIRGMVADDDADDPGCPGAMPASS